MRKLYDEIEEPLIRVLSQMELVGVKVDVASLKDFAESLRKQMLAREAEIREYAGNQTLNVSSPKQMGEVIFEQLKLDPLAKKPTKGNWAISNSPEFHRYFKRQLCRALVLSNINFFKKDNKAYGWL